ncbi:peptidylprolyl isomerase [Polymorphobacter fuscus]|uniref:Peptidyl-prolyl cis-trans isomerase n=1 Tax=Sandarakinorhabdus fusca TaxID=1439888 RepID=A0A7C9KZ23_9SPHN|nr:peptidylprolyl isomerase [Polymorphobacter fuscus]KAB7646341.1 peptidylprolyl isomerase [Polymorphobacter fuscus]MQT17568.1 peptidylprolyl isomerase [Polymorphobacter fuscus]NJC09890.1 peptidylprolyl isomerase [Polymorphobacter fuscus]
MTIVSMLRRFLAFVLLATASLAMAQGGPSKADLKPLPVLPKMGPAPTIAGSVTKIEPENVLVLDLSSGGRVRIVMRPDVAPKHVERIRTLARQGFYDGTVFHRVIEGFMAQGGDPTGTGTGGSKLPDLKAEFNDLPHVRGALAMARAQSEDSANSQFYIVLQPVLKLDRTYTIWGRVIEGMKFVDAIAVGEPPATPTRILKASIETDHVPPPAPSTPIPSAPLAPAAIPQATLPTNPVAPPQ